MSIDELKIREELELDIENNLEEEIKEEIYHLALKLHRLYQQKKQKTLLNKSSHDHQNVDRKKISTEVNINIKLDGGTTIKINEVKKEGRMGRQARGTQGKAVGSAPLLAKFDWEGSLRSKASSGGIVNPRPWDKNRAVRGSMMDKECGYGNQVSSNKGEWKY